MNEEMQELQRHEDRIQQCIQQAQRISELEQQVQRLTTPPTEDDFRAERWRDMATAPDEGPYRMGWAAAFRWLRRRGRL